MLRIASSFLLTMITCWNTFVAVLFSCWLLAHCQTIYPVNRGGGQSGSGVNVHVDGTPDTPKLTLDILCTNDGTGDLYNLKFSVFQNDENFEFSDHGDDDGKEVEYEACYFLDVVDLATDVIDSTTGCNEFSNNGPIDDSTPELSRSTRYFSYNLLLDVTDPPPCGATNDFEFAIMCKRQKGYDKQFDYLFIVDWDDTDCSYQYLTYEYHVGPIPFVDVVRKYDVTFAAYKGSVDVRSAGPKSPDNDPPTQLIDSPPFIDLGETLHLEACLELPDVNSENGHQEFFTENGYYPLGIYIEECYLKAVSNPSSATPLKLMDKGCGTESKGARNWVTNKFVPYYVKDDDDSFEDWIRPPNCFRTLPFEANTFQRPAFDTVTEQEYECKVEYCFSSDDINCFGTKTTEGAGYPSCPRARKKRETKVQRRMHGLPTYLSTRITIAPGNGSELQLTETKNTMDQIEECTETVELVSTTSILSAILLVVIIIVSMMIVSIKSLTSNNSYDVEKISKVAGAQTVG